MVNEREVRLNNASSAYEQGTGLFNPSEGQGGIYFPPGTEVFQWIKSLQGSEVPAEDIINRIRIANLDRVVVMGGSGNGKSTVLDGICATLEVNHSRPVLRHYYDDFLTGMNDDTPSFNRQVVRKILNDERNHPDAVDVVELVGVGKKEEKDRAVSAVEKLARNSKENGNNTGFAIVVGSYAIQMRAGFLRSIIGEYEEKGEYEKIEPFLIEHKIKPVGFGEGHEGGRRIAQHLGRMGKIAQITEIRREEDDLTEQWKEKFPNEFREISPRIEVPLVDEEEELRKVYSEFGLSFSQLDETIEMWANTKSLTTRNRTAYLAMRFMKMGVPWENIFILYNTLREDEILLKNPNAFQKPLTDS